MHKVALDTPTLTDPDHMVSYDCTGNYDTFIDSVASAIGGYSDFLANLAHPEDMGMLGWGKLFTKSSKGEKVA